MRVQGVPNLFLVGVQRSATTALWSYFAQHPDVFTAPKELHYFGRDLGVFGQKTNRGARPDRDQYLAYFDPATTERYLCDASVGYIYSQTAASEIHEFSPDARIVASFRNPIEMLYSLYSLLRFQGAEPSQSFPEALADRTTARWAFTSWPFRWAFTYRELVRYADQLERYFDAFGRDRVHVVIYEDFVADKWGTYRRVLEFLGVDPDVQTDLAVVNANRVVRSKLLQRWLYRPPAVVRRSGKMVLPLRPARREIGKRLIARNRREVSRPVLDPSVRRDLEAELGTEVAKLGELIGRDLGSVWWQTGHLATN